MEAAGGRMEPREGVRRCKCFMHHIPNYPGPHPPTKIHTTLDECVTNCKGVCTS